MSATQPSRGPSQGLIVSAARATVGLAIVAVIVVVLLARELLS